MNDEMPTADRMIQQAIREDAKTAEDDIAEINGLRRSIERVAIGGNHLANVLVSKLGGDFATHWPAGMPHEQASTSILENEVYDVWCAWSAIMVAIHISGEVLRPLGASGEDATRSLASAPLPPDISPRKTTIPDAQGQRGVVR